MNEQIIEKRQKKIKLLKLLLSIFAVALGLYVFTCEGFSDYFFTKTYDVPVTYSGGKVSCEAKGDLLAYVTTETGRTLNFDMETTRGENITIPLAELYRGYEGEQMNLHFVYTWITPASVVLIIFRTVFMLAMLFMLCYAIWHFETGIGLFKQGGAVRWPAAVTMSGTMLLTFNPISERNTELILFMRYIGSGIAFDYDISKVIGNFMKWTAAFVALAFLFMLFFRIIGEKDKDEDERICWEFTHRFFILAMILMILRGARFFADEREGHALFSYSESLTNLILLAFFAYFILRLSHKISFERYYTILAAASILLLPASAIFSDSWSDGRALFAGQFITTVVIVLLVRVLPLSREKEEKKISLWTAVFISSIPLVTCIYIEFISILNQHEVFIAAVGRFYAIGIAMLLLAAFIVPLCAKKLRVYRGNIKGVCYPLLVAGITALSVQPAATAIYEADLYETANYSVLISDFLNHGVIPIVGHYGGHMMTGVWEGIIYGLLNGDTFGASMSPYYHCIRIVIAICFFFLVKQLWDEDMALFATMLFPFAGGWDYFGQGMLIAVAILAFAKKNTLGRAVWIWVAFAWVTLYRLDMGSSFGAAMLVALVAYCLINKSADAAKKIILALIIVAAVAGALWCIFCLFGNINPVQRLIEFIKASASNYTWARNDLGNVAKADFSWGYLFIPMGVALGLGYTLISRRFREDAGEDRYLLLVIFGTAYVANIQRSLVRHTLAVGNYDVVLWSSLIFLAIFISVKKTPSVFLPAFGALMIFAGLLGNSEIYSKPSVAEAASTTLTEHIDAWKVDRVSREDAKDEAESFSFWKLQAVTGNVLERVQLDEVSKDHIELFSRVINLLLAEGETYLDFENHTFLYTATGRENPVYVSQSPMQVSGEFMQECFIEEIESKNVPLAVLPATGESSFASVRLDGLENVSRYYLISEYIYKNYRPFCTVGEYAIWVRPDRYDEMLSHVSVMEETEQIDNFVAGFSFSHLKMDIQKDKIVLTAVKGDPFISGLENCIDLSDYEGGTVKFLIDYDTTNAGELKLYYTTDSAETFSESKVSATRVSGSGTAELFVPVTPHTKLRMDIPDESTFVINSIKTASSFELIDYGYDTFYRNEDGENILTNTSAHIYDLKYIPLLWGEKDIENASEGEEFILLQEDNNGIYSGDFSRIDINEPVYLLAELTYSGRDDEDARLDDEYCDASLRAGEEVPNGITETARYGFYVREGTHTYLFRLSSDYFWKNRQMTSFRLDSADYIDIEAMRIIRGD